MTLFLFVSQCKPPYQNLQQYKIDNYLIPNHINKSITNSEKQVTQFHEPRFRYIPSALLLQLNSSLLTLSRDYEKDQ